MALRVSEVQVKNILTRTSGFLRSVCSHSLQPYRGCSFGNSLCGVGCYVRHNLLLTRGRPWGGFLEARTNASVSYRDGYVRERAWARRNRGGFGIFLSSSTDPFLPQEDRFRVTRRVLETIVELPPDRLMLQTHSHRVCTYLDLYEKLAQRCDLRVQLSIESDRDRLPGLPPPASPIARRFEAAARLKRAGLTVIVTVSPLLPIERPEPFFERVAEVADAVVIDHFIEGDGSADGSRTRRTDLPDAMARVDPHSITLDYRDEIVATARSIMPGRVGVSRSGFAGLYE